MYKALIFDLDGTAIPNRPDGMPSADLVGVVAALQPTMKVCAATGRAWFNSQPIIRKLGLLSPCIISGGTQIIDPVSEKILWEKDMSKAQVEAVMKIVRTYPYQVFFSDDKTSVPAADREVQGPERIIYIEPVTKSDTPEILRKLAAIPGITAYDVASWTPDCFDIHVTQAEATKSRSLEVLLDILHLDKAEVAAAGDSNNDLPLFAAAGYKIAMANGSEEMKAQADFIAPSVVEDGLAVALKSLFLKL